MECIVDVFRCFLEAAEVFHLAGMPHGVRLVLNAVRPFYLIYIILCCPNAIALL